MTPSETLRAAAARLRELANNTTQGPWHVTFSGYGVYSPTIRTEIVPDEDRQHSGTPCPEDAAWIAAMSPAVAEPLAAWLDAEADCQGFIVAVPDVLGEHAVAFARSILEQP